MNKQRALIIITVTVFTFFISTCSAQILNGNFDNDFANWTIGSSGDANTSQTIETDPSIRYIGNTARLYVWCPGFWNKSGYTWITQDVDVTGYDKLYFAAKASILIDNGGPTGGNATVYLGSSSMEIVPGETSGDYGYNLYELSVSGSGVQQLKFEIYGWDGDICIYDGGAGAGFLFDEVKFDTYKISGYVTNNLGNSVSAATITLNNSGGSTTSNDTGYYEITGIQSGTYSITATSPTHQDYSDTVTIPPTFEKNISMTRLTPLLTWTDAETTMNDVFLKWRRNAVVDNVKIYKDTETRLLTTVSSGSTLAGLYSDRNLDCDKGYVYWFQPMDNDVAGPKYRIDAKTDPCDGGGGGGGDPTPTPSPTATPGPTPPPWTNITQEEWLNLTLDQKQEILTNLTMFPPLLEFQWEDIYVWGIHLFLILCGAVALDSITIQKVSEYTGLWAILPGVMFAYLTGYLVI